ncbi:acetyl-CoA hydrolase/transferase family protein [Saccharopolyspora terrae]|uniref:Acetyl-CoA hydrolase/transferase family protein n=1 Tax=Saccharopolyspora terrae TaxID=2530384 RepID=A0A4R4VC70_9PSEU|nr:acetyl-CoA hydrolase/transferase C-terminal domain-containing protein [Saccharopolyspora terrae]TDC99513.1 acetyl-CoA hydrolase/transferase family protein [Saccharopolyspora terrae]
MTTAVLRGIDELDYVDFVRPGDMVLWGQACAEPLSLTEALMRQRSEVGPIRCFVGIPASRTIRPEFADHASFVSYCGSGGNRQLHSAGALDVVPVHYSTLPHLVSDGPLRADVVLLQLPPADEEGRYSLGLADDYIARAIGTARVVIAEINDQVPQTHCSRTLASEELDVLVHTSRLPAELPSREVDVLTQEVAANVAGLIEDGATLQFGIGALPEAVLAALSDRRDLGVHSGLLNDAAVDLMEAGVITNARKSLDRGHAVAGLLMGTRRLFGFAHRNPAVWLRGTGYTHAPEVLAAQDHLVAINSALEVDLSGQVNAELVGSDYVGAVGGAADFLRGAARSRGGVPVVALPSTAGGSSRIVAKLSGPVSTARADAGFVVTEFGVADLRGQPLRARQERMLAIAHPDHRRTLEEAVERSGVLV